MDKTTIIYKVLQKPFNVHIKNKYYVYSGQRATAIRTKVKVNCDYLVCTEIFIFTRSISRTTRIDIDCCARYFLNWLVEIILNFMTGNVRTGVIVSINGKSS